MEGIEGNRPLRAGKIRRNPAAVALTESFAYVIADSIGFQRVTVLEIGLFRKPNDSITRSKKKGHVTCRALLIGRATRGAEKSFDR